MSSDLYAVSESGVAVEMRLSLSRGDKPYYDHRFGGPSRHRGAMLPGQSKPLLLLFDLDLSDPSLFLAIPGVRRLPLYNGIRFASCSFTYQLVSDEEIKIVEAGERCSWTPDFPYTSFPDHFPEQPAIVGGPVRVDYDDDMGESWRICVWDDNEPECEPTRDEMCVLRAFIRQEMGTETIGCRNPDCKHDETRLLAAFSKEPFSYDGIFLWNDGEDHEPDVVIRYRICPECYAIDVANLAN